MAAKVMRMRPKRHDAICESIQLALDLPLGLKQASRDDLAEVLGRFAPPEQWVFVMLNPDQQRLVLKAINNGAAPANDAEGVERGNQPYPLRHRRDHGGA
jgi:hypothetical protein